MKLFLRLISSSSALSGVVISSARLQVLLPLFGFPGVDIFTQHIFFTLHSFAATIVNHFLWQSYFICLHLFPITARLSCCREDYLHKILSLRSFPYSYGFAAFPFVTSIFLFYSLTTRYTQTADCFLRLLLPSGMVAIIKCPTATVC